MMGNGKKEEFLIHQRIFETGKSSIKKYQDLFVGKQGLSSLLKYELILLASSWLPGALGILLRSKLYPLILGKVGKGVYFGSNVILRHPHKIHLGDNVVIDDGCVLDAKGSDNQGIFIGNDVFVGRNTILSCKDGDIYIDSNVLIGFNCEIFSGHFVRLGKNIQIAAYSYLNAGTHDYERIDIPVLNQERSARGIIVEDNAWLAANVKILDGVVIGQDAIVSAGAVVYQDVQPFAIVGGVPARPIRLRR